MIEVFEDESHDVEGIGKSTLFHQTFVHMSKEEMKNLVSKGRMPDPKTMTDASKTCFIGRQNNVSFTKIDNMPKFGSPVAVHSDVYGPNLVSSVRGS